MIVQEGDNRFTVMVSKDVPAPVETVFRYFDTHAFWDRWWVHATEVDAGDAGGGGRFRVTCENSRGDVQYTVSGSPEACERPGVLAFKWTVEALPEWSEETRVTVSFSASLAGALVTVRHVGFRSRRLAALHDEGWVGGLDKACYFIMRL